MADVEQALRRAPVSVAERAGVDAGSTRRGEGNLGHDATAGGKTQQGGDIGGYLSAEGQVVAVDGGGGGGVLGQTAIGAEDSLPGAEVEKLAGCGVEREVDVRGEIFGLEVHIQVADLGGAGETRGAAVAGQVHHQVDIAHGYGAQGGDIPLVVGEQGLGKERVPRVGGGHVPQNG